MPTSRRLSITLVLAGALLVAPMISADAPVASLAGNGELTFSCPALGQSYKVEWAATPEGPWSSSWKQLCQIEPGAAPSATVKVPMFYRVRTPAVELRSEKLSATEAAALIRANRGEDDFTILDVRTANEFANQGRIKGAVNIDQIGRNFNAVLALLPRDRRYLVYCASSGRSGLAVIEMEALGFHTVYDLEGGLSAFVGFHAHQDLIDKDPIK